MIQIFIPLENIQIQGFKVITDGGIDILTTTTGNPHKEGGIDIYPEIQFNDTIIRGNIFVTQICKNYILKIDRVAPLKSINFNSLGNKLKDTTYDEGNHYLKYFIINGKIENPRNSLDNKFYFFDSPFIKLEDDWLSIEYDIEFETWFQYNLSYTEENIKPILSFKWMLSCIAKRENGFWVLHKSIFSSPNEIKESIIYYNESDKPLIPNNEGFLRIYNEVDKAFRE